MITLSPMLRMALTIPFLTSFLTSRTPATITVKSTPCQSCVLNGPTCVQPGMAGIFTLSGGTTVGWTVSCGTIIHSNSTLVEVQFPGSGCSVSNVETAGATCGGASINVIISSSCAVKK